MKIELMEKVLNFITDNPKEHDQGAWVQRSPMCGTTGCLAGHTVLMTGYEVAWIPGDFEATDVIINGADGRYAEPICIVAQRELDLTGFQAGVMFRSSNTLADLWFLANEYSDGVIEVPEQFKDACDMG